MPPRLLIADDDESIVSLLHTFFSKKGYQTELVRNGKEAMDVLLNGTVDLALLDVMMPVMTGLEALERVREAGVTTPIIVATAHGDSDTIVQALELGADDYINKPFDLAVLHARVLVRLRNRAATTTFSEPPVTGETPFSAVAGAVIDGRYELVSQIGRGSFGVVWRARHRGLETEVAVKLLNLDPSGTTQELDSDSDRSHESPRERQRALFERSDELRREGVRAARVQHPHAVRVYDTGALADGTPWLVMELLHGQTLEELLGLGKIPLTRAINIIIPVFEALDAAHRQGVIHRDVKPANIMLHKSSGGEQIKVLDFGVAKLQDVAGAESPGGHLDGQDNVSSRVVAGSPAYLAPERLRGLPYDGRADVYATGIMLYELLTGRVPFIASDGDVMKVALMHLRDVPAPPSTVYSALPAGLDALVLRLIAKDPQARPTAAQAIDLCRDMLDFA